MSGGIAHDFKRGDQVWAIGFCMGCLEEHRTRGEVVGFVSPTRLRVNVPPHPCHKRGSPVFRANQLTIVSAIDLLGEVGQRRDA